MNTKTIRKPAFDTKAFHAHIATNLKDNCERLEFDFAPGTWNAVQAHEHAAAVAISCLMMLRTCSDAKALTRADIQVAIEAAMEGFHVDEHRGPMGDCRFHKKATALDRKRPRDQRLRHGIKAGDVVVLNMQPDATYWLVLDRTGAQLTIRDAHNSRDAIQYTDTSLVAGMVL